MDGLSKCQLFPEMRSSLFLTSSQNHVLLTSVDMSDSTENYIFGHNEINLKHSIGRPGGAVQIIEETGGKRGSIQNNSDEITLPIEKEDMPKVEIQITEDGIIQVISDKETTV